MNKYTLRQSPLVAAIGSVVAAGPAHAATITVTTNADAPVGVLPDQCTLRSAIVSANLPAAVDGCAAGAPGGNEIVFDAGLADSTITLNQGEMEISRALTITGPVPGDPAGMTIDGDNASRLFSATGVVPGDFDVSLNNLTLTRGHTSADQEHGGAIHARYANLLLEHVLVTGNSTAGYVGFGGGLSIYDGDVTLTDSTVSDNSTTGGYGLGGGLIVLLGDATLTRSTVSGNSTAGKSSRGGGFYFGGGNAYLTDSTITDNSTEDEAAWGGGLHMTTGNILLVNSTISDNSTMGDSSRGGGLSFRSGKALLINSTVSGNSTLGAYAYGGGIIVDQATVNLTNSTLSHNSTAGAGADGGALYIAGGSQAYLIHVTAAFNTAADGTDGIYKYVDNQNPGVLSLFNSMVLQAGAGETACNLAPATISHSLATDTRCTGTATDLADIAPGPLADNGGPTLTHELGGNSVAIDAAGDCEADFNVTRDQRGLARPGIATTTCDIGAFEFQGEDRIFRDRFDQ